MLESAESDEVRLISREIIFPEFQPTYMTTIHQRYRQTDGQTDERTDGRTDNLPWQYRALCVASRGKKYS